MVPGKKLKVCPACNKEHYYSGNKDGYCEKHYYQLLRYGKLLDNSPRSIYDSNEYRTEEEVTYISVYDKRGIKLPEEVIIDTEDLQKIIQFKIYLRQSNKSIYPYAWINVGRNKKLLLSRFLCNTNKTVDHINGNTLDNRKANLRPADMSVQNLNKTSTKGIQKKIYTYNGHNDITGYAATMGYKGKRYLSKYYDTEAEAMYYRYLMLQLLPFKTNYDTSFMSELSEEKKRIIQNDFEAKFRNQRLC